MKSFPKYRLLTITLLIGVITLNGCIELPDKIDTSKDDQYTTDIVGRWRKTSESDYNAQGNYLYYVYQADGWGYTWDEGDDISEAEVYNDNYHGNGWFEWSIYNSRLTEKHHFKSSSAITTKTYKITQLTDTQLSKFDETGNKTQRLNRYTNN